MRKVILAAAIFGLAAADASACGRLRAAVGRVVHPRQHQAAAPAYGCQAAPVEAAPVQYQQAPAPGGVVWATSYVRDPAPAVAGCVNGVCPAIPPTYLPPVR